MPPRHIHASAAVGLTIFVAIASACDSDSTSAENSTISTTSSIQTTPSARPSATSSGDPLYDQYAAALTAAGIDFKPGIAYGTYVTDKGICDQIRKGDVDAFDLAGREEVAEKTNNGRRIEIMIPILCPDQQSVLDEARGPNPTMRTFLSGKHFVGIGYNELGHPLLQPGTWKTGVVEDCYWERLDGQGNIIENNLVSLSESVVVTIDPSDAAFTARNCGRWTRVE